MRVIYPYLSYSNHQTMHHAIVDQILEYPDAYLIVQQIQAALHEERQKREAFYNDITDEFKYEFINGEIILHSPVREMHNDTGFLYQLLNVYVRRHKMGFVGVEKIMTALTRNDYDRIAEATGHLLFWPGESRSVWQETNAVSRARLRR